MKATPSKKKIGIISVARFLEGGAEIVLQNLLLSYPHPEQLVLIAPKDCTLDHIAHEQKIRVLTLPSTKDTFFENLSALNKISSELSNLHLIHAWTRRCFELAALTSYRLRLPCSVTLHDNLNALCISKRRRILISISMRKINRLVCVSNFLKSSVQPYIQNEKATVIPNGVCDLRPDLPPKASSETIRIGFPGMHHPQKGFSIIAQWIPRLIRTNPKVRFELFGELNPLWEKQVEGLKKLFPNKIHLNGRVPTVSMLKKIDILVQASYPFEETFGMVFAEAACAGIPVVTSDHGAESEVVVEGQTGFLFDAKKPEAGLNRLCELCENSELRIRLGENARVRYEIKFRSEIMARSYYELWKLMLEN